MLIQAYLKTRATTDELFSTDANISDMAVSVILKKIQTVLSAYSVLPNALVLSYDTVDILTEEQLNKINQDTGLTIMWSNTFGANQFRLAYIEFDDSTEYGT